MDAVAKPLSGVRVLDLSNILMGPLATQILVDYGATVIKVEQPSGDDMRHSEPKRSALMGPMYLHANRGKKSVVLDLKKQAGRDAVLRLAKVSDVLVHNVRPAGMRRLGLAYEDIRKIKDDIIYLALVGFDQAGPYAAYGAVDDVIQGAAGVAGLFQAAYGSDPTYVPMVMADRMVGISAAHALLAAILFKFRTGQGQEIEVPMYETMASIVLGDHLGGETFVPAAGAMGYPRLINPHRKPYRTRDGFITAIIYTDAQWSRFLDALKSDKLSTDDQRFSTAANRSRYFREAYQILGEIFIENTSEAWLELLRAADIPCFKVASPRDLLEDEQLNAVDFFQLVDHPSEGRLRLMRSPIRSSGWAQSVEGHAPRLGEHSVEVLRSAGYPDDEIAAMIDDAVTLAG